MTFTDSRGTEWLVTEISDPSMRSIASDRLRMPEYKTGWLLFQSETMKKRLAPYPDDWRSMPADELERWLRAAYAGPGVELMALSPVIAAE